MYGYIAKTEITDLIQNDRKGYIIYDIKTKDIDEYINCLMAVLRNNGIDINMFTQAKINKNKSNYILLLTIRKSYHITNMDYINIEKAISNIVPCKTIHQWIKDMYKR